jgi:putative endonuclease
LLAKNYQILETNLRHGLVEIDIIALDKQVDEIVFIEVKTRSSAEFGHPSEAVSFKKLAAMSKVARAYLNQVRMQKDYRFDIITVIGKNIEHFENITWP